MENKKSIGLPGGPNEFLKDITQYISVEGYKRYSKDINNPYNIIESSNITMEDVDFPVRGYGNNGVVQDMTPGAPHYDYGNADYVVEVPMAQDGREQATISQYVEPAWYEKALDYLASPMTAFGYLATGQDLPDRLPINAENRNAYDMVIDMVNPAAMVKYAAQAKRDYDNEEYLNATFNTLGAMPIVPAVLSQGKNVVKGGKNVMKNAVRKIPRKVNTPIEGTDMIMTTNSKIGELFDKTGIPKMFWPNGFNYGANEAGKSFVATASNATGDIIDLSKYADNAGDYFTFDNAFVKNPMTAGRSMKAMEKSIPKYGVIKQNPLEGSLSEDSFTMMLQRLKDGKRYKDVTNYGENVFLNRSGKNRIVKPGPTNQMLVNQNLFDASEVAALNTKYGKVFDKLKNKGILNDDFRGFGTREIKIPGLADKVYQVGVPNIGVQKLYQVGGEQPKTWKDIEINKEGLKRAIAEVESINGVLMINPESTATGLYGQRFSELEEGGLYKGTRDEFAKDLEAQNRIFDMRLNKGIKSNRTTPLLKDAFDLTNEYKDQLGDKWNYSYEDLIALSNFLGRGGTREFLGNVIRDGKTLEEVYPTKFGKNAKQANKTPYEYLEKTRNYYQEGGEKYIVSAGDNLGKIANKYKTSVDELARLNNISDPNKININQELVVPEISQDSTLNRYTIKSGDTLGKLATKYNTSVTQLAKLNNIQDVNKINVNQELILPDSYREEKPLKDEAWYSVDDIQKNNDKVNQLTDENIIINSQLLNNPNQAYVVIDKKTQRLKLYRGDEVDLDFEVLTGANDGDAQTVTNVIDYNKDGITTEADKRGGKYKTDWMAGNRSTGAGVYTINQSAPTSEDRYQNAPSFNLLNESGIQVGTSIHGTPGFRNKYFDDGNLENNSASNGCINGKCSDLQALYNMNLPTGTPVFILPEDEGNSFQQVDGKAVMRMSSKNRKDYLEYTDLRGDKQEGQGGNYSTSTLSYKPIRAKLDKKLFEEKVYSAFDFNDDEEFNNTTKPFINALEKNKKEIMQAAQIPGDVYNQIAKIAFGIYGTESNFGDTHSAAGNLGRAATKYLDREGSSSPDVVSKYDTYNVQGDNNSVGYTQIRWSQLNDKEKSALKSLDITSNKDFLDPQKSAIATATILGIRYNEQLTADEKKDVWKNLPSKWNNRSNYSSRVKSNSRYLQFEQLDRLQKGGEIENNIMYKNYINGVYTGSKMESKAEKIYDKLNRLHYRDAKAKQMTPANYVLTHVIG
jgi:LysM repeat protein